MIEIKGWDWYLSQMNAKEIHRDKTGILLELDGLDDGDPIARFVRVQDSSTDRQYALRVAPTVKTAREGVASTFGLTAEEYQIVGES
jgi:hypothetical protein